MYANPLQCGEENGEVTNNHIGTAKCFSMTYICMADDFLSPLVLLLNKYGVELTNEMKTRLKTKKKIDTSKLIESIEYKILQADDDAQLVILMEDYGTYVDQGRGPGKMPPLSKLEGWVKRKKLQWRNKKGRFISYKSIAFMIGRKIGKFGTPPTHFITQTLLRRDKQLEEDIANVMDIAVQKKIDTFLKKNPNLKLKS